MRRVFITRHFGRWMRKATLSDVTLCDAVSEMERGLIDADLGGGLVKKRIGLAGRGKRSGARTLVATMRGELWFFIYGFEKNDRANITRDELQAFQDLATDLLTRSALQLTNAMLDGALQEICDDHQTTGQKPNL